MNMYKLLNFHNMGFARLLPQTIVESSDEVRIKLSQQTNICFKVRGQILCTECVRTWICLLWGVCYNFLLDITVAWAHVTENVLFTEMSRLEGLHIGLILSVIQRCDRY